MCKYINIIQGLTPNFIYQLFEVTQLGGVYYSTVQISGVKSPQPSEASNYPSPLVKR